MLVSVPYSNYNFSISTIPNYNDNNIYFDVKYVTADLKFNKNKIKIIFYHYIMINADLPYNTIYMNVSIPSQVIENVPLYLTNDIKPNIPSGYENYIRIYKSDIEIDISSDSFFQNAFFINQKINMSLFYRTNNNVFSDFEFSCSEKVISDFICEVNIETISLDFLYSNFLVVNNSNTFFIFSRQKIDSSKNIYPDYLPIEIETNSRFFYDNNIREICRIKLPSGVAFSIDSWKLDLKYWYLNKYNDLTYNENVQTTKNEIAINKTAVFNPLKNQFEFFKGNDGIFFPFWTKGFYQLEFKLSFNNHYYNLYFINDFKSKEENIIFKVETINEK